MKNITAAGVAYLPGKWDGVEFKIVSYLKAAVFSWHSLQSRQHTGLENEVAQKADEIEKLKTDLLKKNEQLKNISYHQSHTVRRPLANIIGLTDLVEHYRHHPVDDDFFKLIELLKISTCELDEVIKRNC